VSTGLNNEDFIKMSEVMDQDSSSSPSAVVNNGSPIGPSKSGPSASAPALGSPSVDIKDGDVFKILNWDSIKSNKFSTTQECKLEFEITKSGKSETVIIDHFPTKGKKSIGFINDKKLLAELILITGNPFNNIKFYANDETYIGTWYSNSVSAKVNNKRIIQS
jgi:hypothetical protein